MDLSIAIVSWNTRKLLDECLASVYENTKDIDFEVIVVDNASSDGSAQMVQDKYPQVKIINNTDNVGFPKANNQAYHICSGRYFLLLNPDTVIVDNMLKTMVEFGDSRDQLGALGPCVLNGDRTLQYSWAKFPTVFNEIIGKLDRHIKGYAQHPTTAEDLRKFEPFRVDWIGGCCLMVKRAAIEQIGIMDESIFMYCEETDWCLRLHKAGWEVWVNPRAEIIHYGGESSSQASKVSAKYLRQSKRAYFTKHEGALSGLAVGFGLEMKAVLKDRLGL